MVEDILFLSGSYESQRIAYLDRKNFNLYTEVRKHFIYSCLLSRQVIQPIGHFYQSKIIRNITQEYIDLFTSNELNSGQPIARYAINMFKENFQEDADEKAKTFLGEKEFQCYHDNEFRKILTDKTSNFIPFRRQGKQLDTLANTTLQECNKNGSLYKRIYNKLNDDKKVQIALEPLIKAVQLKEYAILPEYIDYLDENSNLKDYMTLTRIILMDAYAESCAQLYNTAYVNNPIKKYYPIYFEQDYKYEINYLDTNIFDIFLSLIPEVKNAILKMNSKELLMLRETLNFIRFKNFYIGFIDELKNKLLSFEIKKYFLDEYTIQVKKYHENVRDVIEDHPNILYYALDESIKNQSIISTSRYLDYADFPMVGFASEVMEQIIGAYEKYLYEYYKAKRFSDKIGKHNREQEHSVRVGRKEEIVMNKYENIKIGIVTVLPKECATIKLLLDNVEECYFEGKGAGHRFFVGEIKSANGGVHKVALGQCGMGNNKASIRAITMQNHFPSIESIIMVGIAGGIPSPDNLSEHIRLGDIIVSEGVIQYDFVKETSEKVICRSIPAKPSAKLLEALEAIKVKEYEEIYAWKSLIDAYAVNKFAKPSCDDVLHDSMGKIISHPKDIHRDCYPKVFYGKIASANTLLKNFERRQKLKEQYGVLAVEMEASGIADATWETGVGYLVIRGISDYCDDYKNDDWQEYAAMVAACYTRDLIENLPSFK